MCSIPYDASCDALNSPELRPTVFTAEGNYDIDGLCAELARLAYIRYENGGADLQRLEQALALVGFEGAVPFNNADDDTHGFGAVRHSDGLALLAFRGTEPQSLSDIALDLKGSLTEWTESAGQVHAGFACAARGLREAVDDWLQATATTRTQLILTGHSLGAAIATLFASICKPNALVTIGSPRVGDATFVATLDGVAITRYVDCCDLVTDLPPPIGGYIHAGASNYITRVGELAPHADDAFVQADRAAAREDYVLTYAWRIGDVMVRDLADHAPINYVRCLVP
ncbi:lipase family protein [Paraburkholderia sp. CNPSo 3274]|uniref:lipase family protein n=1 Tax=Paraburkholderia sp. CNPSo 3274 TaxID=2940932 RepID=UPI0020B701D6|nr:lipase family protein [Paraburkholderia sp. CNPSo 3274]MCP3709835.1 lipase family protein [Paraburkholderia sp. CNPSo 3274]